MYIYQPISLMRACLYDGLGDRKVARENHAIARLVIQDSVDAHPTNPHMGMALGLAYTGPGRRADAVREARRALNWRPSRGAATSPRWSCCSPCRRAER